jgi:hypothetical protein
MPLSTAALPRIECKKVDNDGASCCILDALLRSLVQNQARLRMRDEPPQPGHLLPGQLHPSQPLFSSSVD